VIKLSDYTPPMLKFIKAHQFACVYVFAINGRKPVKIGRALSTSSTSSAWCKTRTSSR
jgi:hypothetical protein